jgi:glycosyltransferase involved in cell wall biosynthesis
MSLEGRESGLDLLILNWRDLRHQRAGGAEVLTHGHARRLVERGHRVTMFVGAAEGAGDEEDVDGVRVIRRGGPLTTRLHALRWYRRHVRAHGPFDLIIEEVNTLPYFLGRLVGARSMLWIHQLAREVWWHEAPRLVAPLGYALERSYLRLYRSVPAIVLSESTRSDLLELGFRNEAVTVIPASIELPPPNTEAQKEPGLLVYVGRLTPSKRVIDLIEALAQVRAAGNDARLEIVGKGEESVRAELEQAARRLNVAPFLRFTGYLTEDAKRGLLARASLIVMASVREGWGLVVTEANALGTPAVVYDRPGLRDSTIHERTGLVTASDPASLAQAIGRALTEPVLYERLRAGAIEWARAFTWERASIAFERAVIDAAGGRPLKPR